MVTDYKETTWRIGGGTDWHFGPETWGRSANPSYDQSTNVFFTVVKTIVETPGGRIWNTANPAGEATFHFTLSRA